MQQPDYGINDAKEFSGYFKYIYPKELELEKHQSANVTFLDSDIALEDDTINFFTASMPYLFCNNCSFKFYGSFCSEDFLKLVGVQLFFFLTFYLTYLHFITN